MTDNERSTAVNRLVALPPELGSTVFRVISGGQTGADQGGLEAARELGLETGGWAPKGWMTENGPQRELLEGFGLKECGSSEYPARTVLNVRDADMTLIFGSVSGGSKLTEYYCQRYGRPYIWNPSVDYLVKVLAGGKVQVLNVAGNRESKTPGIQRATRELLTEALRGGDNES